MFSSGQITFAILFAIGFIAIIIFSYRKDSRQHLKNYKGRKVGRYGFLTLYLHLVSDQICPQALIGLLAK